MNCKTGRQISEDLFGKISCKAFNPNKAKAKWISLESLENFMYENGGRITIEELNRNGRITFNTKTKGELSTYKGRNI